MGEDYRIPDHISLTALDADRRLMEDYFKPMAGVICCNAMSHGRDLASNLALAILDRHSDRINARKAHALLRTGEDARD